MKRFDILSYFLRTSILFAFWIILSGILDPFHLSIGLACCLLVSFISLQQQEPSTDAEKIHLPGLLIQNPFYVFWILKAIFLAAIHVSKVVLDPKMPMDPKIVKHKTKLKSEHAKVVFANSITLTPGTITLDIVGDDFFIHQIDEESFGDIGNGKMEDQIQKLFRSLKK